MINLFQILTSAVIARSPAAAGRRSNLREASFRLLRFARNDTINKLYEFLDGEIFLIQPEFGDAVSEGITGNTENI